MEKIMQNQWSSFDDFEIACLCHKYDIGNVCEFEHILPIKLANRDVVEQALTEFEFDMAFGE
jgi:uncharacterized protein YaaW (UPF0174 family)